MLDYFNYQSKAKAIYMNLLSASSYKIGQNIHSILRKHYLTSF